MDKSSQYTYCNGNQCLIVERHFSKDRSIGEIIKQYMLEKVQYIRKLDDSCEVRYNHSCDKTVVASTKEEKK